MNKVKKVITYVKNCDTQPWKQGHICLVSFSPEHILLDKMAFIKREWMNLKVLLCAWQISSN